jgi:hypothetical protein
VNRTLRLLLLSGCAALLPQAAAADSRPLHGNVTQLAWMIGGWTCYITKSAAPNSLNAEIARNVAPAPDGTQLEIEESARGLVTHGLLGFDAGRKRWYEIDRAGIGQNQDAQVTSGGPESLQAHALTLNGMLPAENGAQYALRAIYAWSNHDAFSFSAQLLRTDKTWATFERHACRRATPAGSVPD